MRKLWASGIAALWTVGIIGGAAPSLAAYGGCVGDCAENGGVTVDDLVKAVNVALGATALDTCVPADANQDGAVQVNELILAVNNALDGCPSTVPTTAGIVFNGEANRLHAYQPAAGFPRQTVIPSNADEPTRGRDINGQICFTSGPNGEVRFIAGEDTNQGQSHVGAGWGLFELSGVFPHLDFEQLNHLQPHYQNGDEAENYGCGFLSDGRLVTTDVGNQASGPGTGQLTLWFTPLDGNNARYCKLDIAIPTAGQIAIDEQDRIYVTASRATQEGVAGVYRYSGQLPTADGAAGGCGRVDPVGDPLVSEGRITREVFIPGDGHISTPSGLVLIPDGGLYVGSVLNGVIAEYDSQGQFVRRVLTPSGSGLPTPSGNPFGLGLASDGTLYFADIGLRLANGNIGPGPNLGKVRRIRFVDSQPQAPEIMDENLNFPDGIGVFEGTTAATVR
ncbi:MAG: hypothetical protein SF182_18470 [Deltaproteobacteria bacterium]|nr:hypothetical protein [Deltaproteobacteria bacterium]